MKRILSLVSVMLLLFAGTASAQFPGFGGMPQQPRKAISMDPNVKAPKAEVANYSNKLRQVSTTLTYDFNSETCKLALTCYDKQEDKELVITMDFKDDYAAFAKWLKKVSTTAEKMLNKATNENSRQKMDLGKPALRGSIREHASQAQQGPGGMTMNLSPDGHFIIDNEIATWEVKFNISRGGFGGFGGFGGPGGGRPQGGQGGQQPPMPSFNWTFYNLDEFNKLLDTIDKTTLNALNKELIRQGKEMEANYGK